MRLPRSALAALIRGAGIIEKMSAGVAAAIILFLMFLIVADVSGRMLFNSPVDGTIEIASLTLPAIVFLTIAYLQGLKEHVTIDLFTTQMPQTVQLSMDLLAIGIALAVMAIVTWQTGAFAWASVAEQEYSMGIVEVPIWPARVVVAFGSAMLSVRLLLDLADSCTRLVAALHEGRDRWQTHGLH
jgi:TRAP-type C4-dicarboxylate transport system permease small subunit